MSEASSIKLLSSSEEINSSLSSTVSPSASKSKKSKSYAVILPSCSNNDQFRSKNLLNCQLLPLIAFAITLFSIFSYRLKNTVIKITFSVDQYLQLIIGVPISSGEIEYFIWCLQLLL